MPSTTSLLLLVAASVLLNACKKDEAQPQSIANIVVNGDFETTTFNDWRSDVIRQSTAKPNSYTVNYSTEAASSPLHAIKVSCATANNDSTYQLIQQDYVTSGTPPGIAKLLPIPAGSKLTMKAKIKTVNVQGNGISIAIGGYFGAEKGYATAFYNSTENKIPIIGTNDFKEYTISYDAFPANTYSYFVLIFFLPGTTGTAYYDDVTLSVN